VECTGCERIKEKEEEKAKVELVCGEYWSQVGMPEEDWEIPGRNDANHSVRDSLRLEFNAWHCPSICNGTRAD